MADREYAIGIGVKESQTVELSIGVQQLEPEVKLDFFRCKLGYGGMSAESAAGLKLLCDDYRAKIAAAIGREGDDIAGASYDELMCVQLLLSRLITALVQMGFAYAEAKGIFIPKAVELRKKKD